MKLKEIRALVSYNPNALPTQKAAVHAWIGGMCTDYQLALTLTLKPTILVKTPLGTHRRGLLPSDCERIAKRFTQKLNREVFGKYAADKGGKSLKYFPVVEGRHGNKNLHLHFAIGGLPRHIRFNQFDSLVQKAKIHVDHIDTQHKVDIADSGWLEYITKEVGTKDTDNVLWTLV